MPLLATFCTFHVGGLRISAVTRASLKTVMCLGLGENLNFIILTDVDIGAFLGQIRFTDPSDINHASFRFFVTSIILKDIISTCLSFRLHLSTENRARCRRVSLPNDYEYLTLALIVIG